MLRKKAIKNIDTSDRELDTFEEEKNSESQFSESQRENRCPTRRQGNKNIEERHSKRILMQIAT